MLKYGFYDAVDRDRAYDAEDMGRLFEGIITDGVFAAVGDKFFVLRCTAEKNSYLPRPTSDHS